MPDYRAFVVGPNGHFVRVHEFACETDQEAIDRAAVYVDDNDVEIWQLGRFVERLSLRRRAADSLSEPKKTA